MEGEDKGAMRGGKAGAEKGGSDKHSKTSTSANKSAVVNAPARSEPHANREKRKDVGGPDRTGKVAKLIHRDGRNVQNEEDRKARSMVNTGVSGGVPLSKFVDLESYMEPSKYLRLHKLSQVEPEQAHVLRLDIEHQVIQRFEDFEAFFAWFKAHRDDIMQRVKLRPGVIRLLSMTDRDDMMQELLDGDLLKGKSSSKEGVQVSEALWSNVVKWLSSKGEIDRALEMVNQMREANIVPRVRTYLGALTYLSEKAQSQKDLDYIRQIHGTMEELKVDLRDEEDVYHLYFNCCLRVAKAAKANEDLSLQRLALSIFDDLLVNWFFKSNHVPGAKTTDILRERVEIDPDHTWEVTDDVVVDADSGKCGCCSETLASIEPSPEKIEAMLPDLIEYLKTTMHNRMDRDAAIESFDRKINVPYDVLIDAANIAHYKQNFGNRPRWSFVQLQQVLDAIGPDKHKLVVMHRMHTGKRHMTEAGNREAWRKLTQDPSVTICTIESGNDDLFWLLAAMKANVPFVSNDFLRDHVHTLLSSPEYLEWKERHQAYYRMYRLDALSCQNIDLYWPPKFSIRAQATQSCWHLPYRVVDLVDFSENENALPGNIPDDFRWVCFRRASSSSNGKT
ncbi:Proteinaceous RNase P 3 [Hondaea fermentalgiana]|uniref:ribonuclease P n=1 Tax=Hondaea fermentalgiana TaxID=2315210 RepID=A0A2R5G6K7_9STRA|nr:Proteinaceous RNase P 3 [Hondaea fermentalgiana]|eukprot:GBG26676.1 Proteinaceous RNase P 3 [Hondaea fermentalgiana]